MTTGTCTECGRTYTLRIGGTIRAHGRPRCPGSNQAPAEDHIMPAYGTPEWDDAAALDETIRRDLLAIYGDDKPLETITGTLAEVGDNITSILDENFGPFRPDVAYPIADSDILPADVPEVVRLMAAEHNDLLRMADCRTLAAWAAGKRDEIQAMAEEQAVRNDRYDRALEQFVTEVRRRLAAVTA